MGLSIDSFLCGGIAWDAPLDNELPYHADVAFCFLPSVLSGALVEHFTHGRFDFCHAIR